MPTRNIQEASELGTPRSKGQNCWFQMVSAIEGFHCNWVISWASESISSSC